jgi:ankyrin repeat protein
MGWRRTVRRLGWWHAMTMLHQVAKSGDVVELRRQVAMGVNVDERDENGATALLWAVLEDHVEVIRVLAESGADKEATTARERTALHIAAREGHVEAMIGANKEAKG